MTRLRDRLAEINWTTGLFIVGYHVALLVGLPFYFVERPPGLPLVAISLLLLLLTEIGIGAAYHRFYAHRSYRMDPLAEGGLLFLATLATQGSALQWAHDHRLHHAFTDTDRDPYSIRKGFWYAHVLWLFEKSKPIEDKRVRDLLANPLIRFQHRWAGTLAILSNLAVCALVGWLVGDYLGAFVLAWWTRLAVSHHLTWFVNSLAHTWGARTFSKEQSAVDNFVLALLTVGEGYHNFHHTFPNDYRNGVRWYHFDPTKWTIWTLSKLGLARDLHRASAARIQLRLLLEDRRLLLGRIKQRMHARAEALEHVVEDLATRIQEKLAHHTALCEKIARLRQARSAAQRRAARAVHGELRRVRQSLRRDWRAWHRLTGLVEELAATA